MRTALLELEMVARAAGQKRIVFNSRLRRYYFFSPLFALEIRIGGGNEMIPLVPPDRDVQIFAADAYVPTPLVR